jgi:hypothetical protein
MVQVARNAFAFCVSQERLRLARFIMRRSIDEHSKENKALSLALFDIASELALSVPD